MTPGPIPSRSHEHVLEIGATPAEVWEAITRAEELVRWFPTSAEVTPGPGGEIRYGWDELVGRCRILAWDPPRHLRTGWMEAPAGGAGDPARATLAVDWFLEANGATTRLRLVHSGFTRDARWDEEFDGTRRGWTFELQALRHYLERHRGRERRASWIRHPVTSTPAEVWQRLSRPGPVFHTVALEGLAPGEPFRLQRADGEWLEGRVLVNHPPLEFAAALARPVEGMLRFGFEACMGRPEAHLWLATWGLRPERFEAFEGGWKRVLREAFVLDSGSARAPSIR